MTILPTLLDRRIKAAMPTRSAWLEAWGFILCGIGVFLALACYTYTPYDYSPKTGEVVAKVSNLAGPWGAIAAAHVLGRFGVIGMAWPIAIMLWGGLTFTGFVVLPKPRRFLGFVALAATLAGFAEIELPLTSLPEPSFGFGGRVGFMIKASLMPQLGYGGTLIALTVIGIVTQVLFGNLTISRTAEVVQWCFYHFRRLAKKAWVRYVLNREPGQPAHAAHAQSAARVSSERAAAPITPAPAKRRAKAQLDDVAEEEAVAAAQAPSLAEDVFPLEIDYRGQIHGRPDPKLFAKSQEVPSTGKDYDKEAKELTQALAEFKIMGEITKVTQGPVVTTYEFAPAPGTKISKIAAMGDDLARILKATSLRVLAPIPGKDTVGFEVPNATRAVIGFRDLLDDKEFRSTKRQLPIAMGVDIFGKPVFADLAEMPHLLVAGSTGSGKSVFMNTLIGSLIARHSAKDLRLIMVDPKMVEMAAYNGLPHMACPVITDPQGEALHALRALATEMDDRYQRMRELGARNITSFNQIIRTRRKQEFPKYNGKWATMPYIVLIIDEMADMMMVLGKEAEQPITRLAQKARACGIHLVIATQRPSAEVVTGLIKANFPTRVAFRVLSGLDSRTILDTAGAETLLGKGDMLYLTSGGMTRIHGAYLSEDEVQKMVKACGRK